MTSVPSLFGLDEQPGDSVQEELLAEVQHLRQMLADANEEKNIQVAIVRDEVAEKQSLVEDIARQRMETQLQLQDARDKLATAEEQTAKERDEARLLLDAANAEADLQRAEALRLRATNEDLRSEVERLRAAFVPMEMLAKVATVVNELRELCLQTHALLGSGGPPLEQARAQAPGVFSACDLEAELLSLRDAAAATHAAADHVAADRRELVAKFEEMKQLRSAVVPAFEVVLSASEAPVPALEVRGAAQSATEPSGSGTCIEPGSEEMALVMSKHAAQAIKEIRLNAEQQLAWISKRMRMSQ